MSFKFPSPTPYRDLLFRSARLRLRLRTKGKRGKEEGKKTVELELGGNALLLPPPPLPLCYSPICHLRTLVHLPNPLFFFLLHRRLPSRLSTLLAHHSRPSILSLFSLFTSASLTHVVPWIKKYQASPLAQLSVLGYFSKTFQRTEKTYFQSNVLSTWKCNCYSILQRFRPDFFGNLNKPISPWLRQQLDSVTNMAPSTPSIFTTCTEDLMWEEAEERSQISPS